MPRKPLVQVRIKPEDFDLLREGWVDQGGSWSEFLRTRLMGIPAAPSKPSGRPKAPDPGIPGPPKSPGRPVTPDPGIPEPSRHMPAEPVRTGPEPVVEKCPASSKLDHNFCTECRHIYRDDHWEAAS